MFVLLMVVACSRETPAPAVQKTSTGAPPAVETAPRAAETKPAATYADAVTWFRSTPGFRFVIEENGIRAEGEMTRPTVGAERLAVDVNGEAWTAESGPRGVVWSRGGKESPAPEWGSRVWLRATVAFDPEKREGDAQLVGPGHYRFTDANSGAVHEVWVGAAGQIEKMIIGKAMSMTLSAQK